MIYCRFLFNDLVDSIGCYGRHAPKSKRSSPKKIMNRGIENMPLFRQLGLASKHSSDSTHLYCYELAIYVIMHYILKFLLAHRVFIWRSRHLKMWNKPIPFYLNEVFTW